MRISDWSSGVCASDLGRQVGRPARPAAPQRPRELLPALVAFLREGIDFAPLPGDDLREDMRGRAKAVKSDAPAVACHSQRAPADQACAKRSEEHTSELQSLMRISYAVFCLKKTNTQLTPSTRQQTS